MAEEVVLTEEQRVWRAFRSKGLEAFNDFPPQILELAYGREMRGGLPGEMPIKYAQMRDAALDRPSFLAAKIIDKFYAEHFESTHYEVMDEVAAPYIRGETFKLGDTEYHPQDWNGLLILLPRGVFKSSMMRLLLMWTHLWRKLRAGEDARSMYVHQVIDKAIKAGEAMRATARYNKLFKRCFPEFRGKEGEWDTKKEWRWLNFASHQASEFSFTAYGESSDKTGGHYTEEFVDDWETSASVNTTDTRETSWSNYEMMDNLKDLSRSFTPRVVCGTTYHYQGVHRRLEQSGAYIVYKVPAHRGSAKAVFDLCSHDLRTQVGRRRLEAGIRKLERERSADLCFPKLYPWRALVKAARGAKSNYGGQKLLDPVPEGEQRFDPQALDDAFVDHLPEPEELWIYVRCDPAISAKRENDECAISVGGVDWRGWRWHVDGWAGRERRPTEIVRKLFRFARKWQARGYKVVNIGIESVSFQEALAQLCRAGVPERDAAHHGESIRILKAPCPVRSIKRSPDMRKTERILEIEGPIARREFKILRDNPIAERVHLTLKNFPHDRYDIPDTVHDLWEGTLVPPRQSLGRREPRMHPAIRKLLKRQEEGEQVVMHNKVEMIGWG